MFAEALDHAAVDDVPRLVDAGRPAICTVDGRRAVQALDVAQIAVLCGDVVNQLTSRLVIDLLDNSQNLTNF